MEKVERRWWNTFSAYEIMVAETLATLLSLPPVTKLSDECFGFPFIWGRRKRRSAISVPVSWPSHTGTTPFLSPSKAEDASSPATPLSFSPASESDDKDNPAPLPSNSTLKRKRKRYLKIIQELRKDNELLTGEIKNVQCYYDRVKDFNFKLKARKWEWAPPTQTPTPQSRESEGGIAQPQQEVICGQQTTSLAVAPSGGSGSATSKGNNIMGPSPSSSPIGIPDLNLPFEVEKEESMTVVECCEAKDNEEDINCGLSSAK